MNLTWHLIRKDLLRSRWALFCWAVGLGYLFLQTKAPMYRGELRDYLHIVATLTVVVLGVGLIADVVQADHPMRDDSHWRTLPISAGRLVTAKLLLIAALFVVAPVVASWIRHLLVSERGLHYAREYFTVTLILLATALSFAATAACTRNVVQCLALWLVLVFGAGALASYLDHFAPVLSRQGLSRMGADRVEVILALSIAFGLAVVLNQYLRRNLAFSGALLLLGAVSTALIGTFWGYFYFYGA